MQNEGVELYENKYKFTKIWPSQTQALRSNLQRFLSKDFRNYLEIGLYDGRTLLYMSEQILLAPDSRLFGIELYPKESLLSNLKIRNDSRVVLFTGRCSDDVLLNESLPPMDVIYIDGSHNFLNVLGDAFLSWKTLKPGGILIFDDYLLQTTSKKVDGVLTEVVAKEHEKACHAIDIFLEYHSTQIEILHHKWQVWIRKK